MLYASGIPLARALTTLVRQSPPPLRPTAEHLLGAALSGQTLSRAARSCSLFGPIHLALLEAGESSGRLDSCLHSLADYEESRANWSERVRSAMIYPGLVLTCALTFLLLVMPRVFAIPASAAWPWLTLLVLAGLASRHLPRPGPWRRLQRTLELLAFLTCLRHLLGSGSPLWNALRQASQQSSEEGRGACLRLHQAILEGASLSRALQGDPYYPPLFLAALDTGMESGRVEPMLAFVERHLQGQLEADLERLNAFLGPCVLLILGVAVASLLTAALSPYLQLLGSLG